MIKWYSFSSQLIIITEVQKTTPPNVYPLGGFLFQDLERSLSSKYSQIILKKDSASNFLDSRNTSIFLDKSDYTVNFFIGKI